MIVRMILRLALCGCLFACGLGISRGEDWPMWRGARGDGTSLERNVPTEWSATNNIVWKTPIPGEGHSSPIVWGDRLFLSTALKETEERCLLSLNRKTGEVLWQQTVLRSPLEAKNSENSYASSTPATDGRNIFVTFLDGQDVVAAACDFAGRRTWLSRPGQFYSQHGFSHTPVLYKDKVILVCYSKGENFIAALSRRDGHTLWKVEGTNATQSYSPPLLRKMARRMQMIVPGNQAVTSVDPVNGHTLWVLEGPSEDCVITPVYNERADLVLSCSSWPKRVLQAIKPDGEGNVTQTKIAWSSTEGAPYVPSPISIGDWFFTCGFEKKDVYCFEAASGKILWHEKMGSHHASPVSANGLVYFLNDDGVTHVIKAGPTFQLIASNDLGERTFASPAISRGQIFLRGSKNLYCIGQDSKRL